MEEDLPDDFGPTIVCAAFDLEEALLRENALRMAREDAGLIPEGEEQELDAPSTLAAPLTAHAPAPFNSTTPLTGLAKKKQKKRARERAKRQTAAREAEDDDAPPAPSPRVLQKAADSSPIRVSFSANDFRASQPRWIGVQQPLEHPLLPHARDAEYLKKNMQYADWQGKKTHVVVDKKGHVIAALIAPPVPGEEWDSVVKQATAAMRAAREKMTFPADAYHHRRAFDEGFPTCSAGFAFGGGREEVGNVRASPVSNSAAMAELMEDPSVNRMATYPYGPFQALLYPIYAEYIRVKRALLKKYPGLKRTFRRSPFTAVTVNLGPFSVSPPHADQDNKADGMCLIGALGTFDADKGGQVVLWDYNLIVRFPAGCSVLIPSAVVTHSNTPIQAGEERYSIIQYSAGGLFRWVANKFKSDKAWLAKATAADLARRERERQGRWATALKKFTLWKDVKVQNFTGRGRVEVWDTADIAEFSDLTDLEGEGEGASEEERPSPPKKIHCA